MAITNIHEDIIKTHILTKLDGQTLATTTCTSSILQTLCSDHNLWSNICNSTYPSTTDPQLTTTINNFNSGHRSFFSDSFSSPTHHLITTSCLPTNKILSSVDIKYDDQTVFSKVEYTNTTPTDWFQTSPFRIDLLEPKEIVLSPVKLSGDDNVLMPNLEKNVTLSWIVIDPVQNRAVNVSGLKPVTVQRNWLTNDVELTFATVIVVINHNGNDYVNCNVQVTCGVNEERGELSVSGVSLTVLDVYGKCLSGKDSMVILQGLAAGPRRRKSSVEEERERYDAYIQRRREKNEKTERRERRLDMACVASGVVILMAFWSFAIY
ncbi:hypothetical protein QVD17_35136 [Tagetes erecta]|uniref:F-box protein n=1 Tax=Tagetes erecta TaxID=13708 RepID=A0AAD8JYT2_TARER|nr:hypothetical protein QVD17_35136 [Tagetes erecta]